jgi:hypothetical protein
VMGFSAQCINRGEAVVIDQEDHLLCAQCSPYALMDVCGCLCSSCDIHDYTTDNLCLPLALLYNKQRLADTSSLERDEIRLRGAMLQKLVGCQGEMIPPAQQRELLLRTGTSCALMDRDAGLLVILGLTKSTFDDISLCFLESPTHVRSYFEATGQPGRTLSLGELCAFAEAEGLQLIHHREGSRYWQSRPVGGDSATPTAKRRRPQQGSATWMGMCQQNMTPGRSTFRWTPTMQTQPATWCS